MTRFRFVLRILGLFIWPILTLFLIGIYLQNLETRVETLTIMGGWWQLQNISLSHLLLGFFVLGGSIPVYLWLVLRVEMRIHKRLKELQSKAAKAEPQNTAKKPKDKDETSQAGQSSESQNQQ